MGVGNVFSERGMVLYILMLPNLEISGSFDSVTFNARLSFCHAGAAVVAKKSQIVKSLENMLTSIRVVSQTDGHFKSCSVTPQNAIVALSLGGRKLKVQQIDGWIVEISDSLGSADANASE
jgi:hypothetical protein